jgi:hypothetical protein
MVNPNTRFKPCSKCVQMVQKSPIKPPRAPKPDAPCPEQVEANERWDRFTDMVRKVVSVPKTEVVKSIEREKAAKEKRAK